MFKQKYFLLNEISVGNRLLFPIAKLKFSSYENIYFDIEYEVSAFKIIENNKIYFKNVNLSKIEYNQIKKELRKKDDLE